MMQKRLFTIWTGVMLAVAAFFAGCSDTTDDDRLEQETMAGNIYLRLRMNRAGSEIPDGSRSIARTGEETPETDDENTIHRMDLLVYNIDDAGNEPLLSDVVPLDEKQIEEITSEKGVLVPLYIQNEKRLRIYAAANLTDKMRERFVLKQTTPEVSISFTADDYGSVINEFVPGSDGSSEGLEKSESTTGIPMTGQFLLSVPASEGGIASATQGDLQTILVDPEKMTREHPLDIETEMVRMVAKIHVLAMAEEGTLDEGGTAYYVSATPEAGLNGGTGAPDRIGWIRLENVKYLPNGINKSTYFFRQPANGGTTSQWKDLNMDWGNYDPTKTEATDWKQDFCFYDNKSLHEENILENSHFAQAERYDESLSGADNPHSERGMYCPENYFFNKSLTSPDAKLNNDKKGIPMVTHVSIAAKLTPKSIVVSADYEDKMDDLVQSYNGNKSKEEYGLEKEDFTDKDEERWNEIKQKYFTGDGETSRNSTFRIIETDNEADAVDLLDWSLKSDKLWSRNDKSESGEGKYPSGTFFVYDTTQRDNNEQAAVQIEAAPSGARYLYFSAGAFNERTDAEKKYFEQHRGGWGYYYTYLSNESTDEGTDGQTPYTDSQVTRNAYYRVTINNFGTPGSGIAP